MFFFSTIHNVKVDFKEPLAPFGKLFHKVCLVECSFVSVVISAYSESALLEVQAQNEHGPHNCLTFSLRRVIP